MTKIILHVGIHKTGTTSIQRTFVANRDILQTHGIHYLSTIGQVSGNHGDLYSAFHPEASSWGRHRRKGVSVDSINEKNRETIEKVTKELSGVSCEFVLISSEHLCQLPEEDLYRLKDWLGQFGSVHPVYFLRNIESWMNSNSQQIAKGGLKSRPTKYEDAIRRMYDFPLNYLKVFDKSFVTFVKFEEAVNTGLCDSLLKPFALPTLQQMGIRELRENDSVSDQSVECFYILNQLRPARKYRRNTVLRSILEKVPGQRYATARLSPDEVSDYQAKMLELGELANADVSYRLAPVANDVVTDTPFTLSREGFEYLINELEKMAPGARDLVQPFVACNPRRAQQDIILRLYTLTGGGEMKRRSEEQAAQ